MKPITTLSGIALLSGAVLTFVAALAVMPQPSRADGQRSQGCVNSQGMDTTILDENTLLASNGSRSAVIRVSGCRLDSSKVLVFEYHGSSQICGRMDVELTQMSSTGTGFGFQEACFIDSVQIISKEEAKALKAAT